MLKDRIHQALLGCAVAAIIIMFAGSAQGPVLIGEGVD